MKYWNEYDIESAVQRCTMDDLRHALYGAMTIANLADWANNNSDGWAYWPKPLRAAGPMMDLLDGIDRNNPEDVTEEQVKRALRPIKAFLTRQGVAHGEVLP